MLRQAQHGLAIKRWSYYSATVIPSDRKERSD